jgi:ComF family protein
MFRNTTFRWTAWSSRSSIHAVSPAPTFSVPGSWRRLAVPLVPSPDLVLPVPLAPARLAERGFNQAVELARPLAKLLGVPLETSRVHRRRDTVPQASLPWKERKQNIRHAFECELDLTGKQVLVVDDVMTTGATLDELARTLKAHGAARVENFVLARALKD